MPRGRPKGSKNKPKDQTTRRTIQIVREQTDLECAIEDAGGMDAIEQDGTELTISVLPGSALPGSAPTGNKRGRRKKYVSPAEEILAEQASGDATQSLVEQIINKPTNKLLHKKEKVGRGAEFGAEYVQPGDNARFIQLAMYSMDLPRIDLKDINQVEQRVRDYLQFCIDNDYKPSIVGVANWLGTDRHTLWAWSRGENKTDQRQKFKELAQRIYSFLEQIAVDYFQNGKTNPVASIFLLKNWYGYRDQTDVVVTPNNPLGTAESSPQLADKYLEMEVIDPTAQKFNTAPASSPVIEAASGSASSSASRSASRSASSGQGATHPTDAPVTDAGDGATNR